MPSFVSATNLLEQAGVSLTTTGEVAGLAARNLLTSTLAEVWRTASNTGSIQADLGSAQAAQAIVLAAPRDGLLPAAGSLLRVTASSVSSSGSEIYDSGSISLALPRGYQCLVLTSPVTARWWTVALTAPSTQAYLQFGRLWIGPGLYTTQYLEEGNYTPALADAEATPVRRQVQFTLPMLTQPQGDLLEDMAITLGTQVQGLFIPRTERADRTALFGKLTTIPAPRPRQAWTAGVQLTTATLAAQEDR